MFKIKIRLNQENGLAKRIGFFPKYFKGSSKIYTEYGKKLFIEYIEVTEIGRGYFKNLLKAVHKEGYKIYIPQAPIYLKKIIRKYYLPFDLWVDDDEKLCLDNDSDIHLHWLEIYPEEKREEEY